MKILKNTGKILLFLFLLAVFLSFLSSLTVPQPMTHIPQKDWIDPRDLGAAGIISEKENTIDIVITGDSESFTAISPYRLWEKQKITSYVCGQSAQHTAEAYYLLKRAFRLQNPKLVILETDELFTCAGLKGESELAVTEAMKSHFPVLTYHNRWKEAAGLSEQLQMPQDETSYKGFQIRKSACPYEGKKYMEPAENAAKISLPVRFYLEKIQELCRRENCGLLLLGVPSPKNWNTEKHNGTAQCAEELGIPFLDLNCMTKEIGIDWQKDSYDGGDHLNLSGAEKVTDYLGKYLRDNYHFRENYSDETLRRWNAGMKKYQDAAASV